MRPVDLDRLLMRIEGEYWEMPGLSLTFRQATRLWGLDNDVCRAAIDALVKANFLSRTPRGSVVRRDVHGPARS